jgi:aryl carrier-like protein
MTTTAVQTLLDLPGTERLDRLEAMVVAEFRAALLMEPDEPLAVDAPYFELGLTSLRITEAKKRLERLLGVSISSNVLFNRPTVAQLTGYLADEALPEVFAGPARPAQEAPAADADEADDEQALLAALLPELNQA